jgi:hypothetical protein
MSKKSKSKDTEYRDRRDTRPSRQSSDEINARNNNQNVDDQGTEEPNVQPLNSTGIGDSSVDGDKLTNYTSNHSADA